MKKILSKIFIIICVMGLIAVTLSSSKVQATLQSNPNTHYTKRDSRATNWMSYFRYMEMVGGALGLSETIDGTTKLATSESNNLDSHMIKSTEYGAIAILSASGYGNPKTLQNSTMKTTTGNETGVYFNIGSSSTCEWVAGDLNGIVFSGVDGRYYDIYANEDQNSAKKGDALGTASTTNPGCAMWHGTSNSGWMSAYRDDECFTRNYNGIFGYNATERYYTAGYHSRGVIVCGEGF